MEIDFSHSALFRTKTRVCLKYFVHDCLWKQFLLQFLLFVLSNLIYLTILVTLRPLTQFKQKLEELICKKVLKFVLLDIYFPNLFTELEIRY